MKPESQDIEQLLAAYALEALDADEKSTVDAHLITCPSCREALADYQSVSDGLMFALPPQQPSAGLRARLIAETAPEPSAPEQNKHWSTVPRRLLIPAGVAALLVVLVFNFSLMRRTNQILEVQQALIQQNNAYQTAFALMTYPTTQIAVIDDDVVYGTLVYDPEGRVAVMNVWGLGELPEDQDYQVWLIEPDESRVSGGVFRASDEVAYASVVIDSPERFTAFNGIGITIEPQGGSPAPTGPRIFGVDF